MGNKVGTDGPTGLPAAQELLPCPICGAPPCISEGGERAGCEGLPRAHHDWFDLPTDEWNLRAPQAAAPGGVAPTPSLGEENKRLREALERTEISALNFVGVARNMHRRQIMGLEALEITLKVLDSFKSVARTALRNGEPG